MKKLAVLLILITFSPFSLAALIASDTTAITRSGQSYSTSVVLDGSSYTDVTLDLTAKGDYGYTSNEWFEFYIDGVLLAHWSDATSGISVITNIDAYDYTLSDTLTISEAMWETFAADGVLEITWVNGPMVTYYPSYWGGEDYVSYTLSGSLTSVAEPATLALMGLGLVGLGLSRRRA